MEREQPQDQTEQLATVTYLHGPRRVQRIHGVRINLGRLSAGELGDLEFNCQARLADAVDDLTVVQEFRDTYGLEALPPPEGAA